MLLCLLAASGSFADYPTDELQPDRGTLLVAHRAMQDPTFANTVILILQRDTNGTYGVILNRRSNIGANIVMPKTDWSGNPPNVYLGGPVAVTSVRILIRSERQLNTGKEISDQVWYIDTLEGVVNYSEELAGKLASNVYLGYAGWLPGQLEAEIGRGDWHVIAGDAAFIFSEHPEDLWFELQQQLQQIWAVLPGSIVTVHHMD